MKVRRIGLCVCVASMSACEGDSETVISEDSTSPLSTADVAAAAVSPAAVVLYDSASVTATQEGDWIRYRHKEPLAAHPDSQVYRGARTKDGDCNFSGGGSTAAMRGKDEVLVGRTVAMNPTQCLMEMESSWIPTSDARRRHLLHEDSPSGTRIVDPGSEAGSPLQLETTYTYHGHYQAQVEDPVHADVADVMSAIEWNSNSSCVTDWHRWPEWYYLAATTWYLNNSSWSGTDPNGSWCANVNETTSGTFYNVAFCAFTLTYVNHSNIQYNAKPNGAAGWTWNTTWGGLCKGLLQYNFGNRSARAEPRSGETGQRNLRYV